MKQDFEYPQSSEWGTEQSWAGITGVIIQVSCIIRCCEPKVDSLQEQYILLISGSSL